MEPNIFRLFADILEYPSPDLPIRARECVSSLAPLNPGIAEHLREFVSYLGSAPRGEVEEVYTRTFDMEPLCAPYAGYQILGEDHRRSVFMARLKEYYGKCGFGSGSELPDHLSVILRFLALGRNGKEERELVSECLTPAIARMVERFSDNQNPYGRVLRALLLLLKEEKRGTE